VFSGKGLADRARKGSATARALLAYEVTGGIVDRLTKGQAVALAGANRRYVGELCRMTPLEVAAVHAGRIRLTDRVNCKPLTPDQIDKQLDSIGEARVWAWFEKRTRPVAAE
jgi:hypothetical protein